MAMSRVQVLMEIDERERFRRLATRSGQSLSAWIREAARQRLEAEQTLSPRSRREAIEELIARCDEEELEPEPDWEEAKKVILASKIEGLEGL